MCNLTSRKKKKNDLTEKEHFHTKQNIIDFINKYIS